jgi:hypothetical protein
MIAWRMGQHIFYTTARFPSKKCCWCMFLLLPGMAHGLKRAWPDRASRDRQWEDSSVPVAFRGACEYNYARVWRCKHEYGNANLIVAMQPWVWQSMSMAVQTWSCHISILQFTFAHILHASTLKITFPSYNSYPLTFFTHSLTKSHSILLAHRSMRSLTSRYEQFLVMEVVSLSIF